jgi:phage-related protein
MARLISWNSAARKDFSKFPKAVQEDLAGALEIAADGEMPDIAKPLHGFGPGVIELALRRQGEAWRVVFTVRIGADLWVIHAFQKKKKSGIATPKHEFDLVAARISHLRRALG